MSGFRYWLADLISRLALSVIGHPRLFHVTIGVMRRQREAIAAMQSRLDRIAALETPSANATVRKMAKIARGEA